VWADTPVRPVEVVAEGSLWRENGALENGASRKTPHNFQATTQLEVDPDSHLHRSRGGSLDREGPESRSSISH
jgi:hypothetical protein